MNAICTDQNADRQLERLAAQRALYSESKTIFAVYAVLSTVVTAGLSVGAMFCPDVKPWAVAWGLTLLFTDHFWLTPWQKDRRQQAALIQESFDCELLGLPWGATIRIGKPVEHEVVVGRAAAYKRKEPSLASLRDWYPQAVCRMPLFLGRVVCQRTNAWWDGKQRRHYAFWLLGGVVAVMLGVLVTGLARKMQVGDLLVTVVIPLLSGIGFALKQYRENIDAAGRLDKLKEHAQELFRRALAGETEAELTRESRVLQDEICDHRKRDIAVFDWLYLRLRCRHETQMQANAEEMVRQLEAARVSAP